MPSVSSSINTNFKEFTSFTKAELKLEYVKTCSELAASNLELSDAMQEKERDWTNAYRYSNEQSISAREKEARVAIVEAETEVIKIRGEIFALKEQKSIIEFLIHAYTATEPHSR